MAELHPLEERARLLTHRINSEIEARCANTSHFQWDAIAEDVARGHLQGEWDFVWATQFMAPPTIAITRYLSPEPFEAGDID